METDDTTGAPRGALVVLLSQDQAEALAALSCRLSRSKLLQFRVAHDKGQARRMAESLDVVRESLLLAGVDAK